MSFAQSIFAEFEAQAPITRTYLERLPEDRLTWKPHEKSMSAGQLALHIARVPGGSVRFVQQNPAQAPNFNNVPQPSSVGEILGAFDESIATVRTMLPQFSDATMQETWRMVQGDQEVLSVPRAQFLRDIMLSHWFQHRGRRSVSPLLLTVAVPAPGAPSADEQLFFQQKRKAASAAPAA